MLAGSGCYSHYSRRGRAPPRSMPTLREAVQSAFDARMPRIPPEASVLYIRTASGREVVVLVETPRPLSATDRALVEVFCSRLSVAFDNVILYEQLHEANVRLEERVRDRTRALTSANERLTSQWSAAAAGQRIQERGSRHRRARPEESAGVILGRAEMMNELAPLNPMPLEKIKDQLGHIRSSASQLTGMVNDLIADAMMDALDIAIRREPVDLAAVLARSSPPTARSPNEEPDHPAGCRRRTAVRTATPTGCARRSTISSATPSSTARSAATSS